MLNIYTDTGVRLDLYPNATIEVNMGGISLLNLQDRTATYTNSFKLPRTPINEAVFQFASQPTRNNRPVINVTITKGLFQRRAVLKVLEFGNEYKCSVKYDSDSVIDILNNNDRDVFPIDEDGDIYVLGGDTSAESAITDLFEWQNLADEFRPYMFCSYSNTTSAATNVVRSGNCATLLIDWLTWVGIKHSLTFSGDLLSDADFLLSFMTMPNYCFRMNEGTFAIYSRYSKLNSETITINSVLKAISQIFFADVIINGTNIELKKVSGTIANTPVDLEGFNFEKKHYSGYLAENNIKYTAADDTKKTLGMDMFTGDGVGVKDVLTITSYIPKTDSIGYVTNDGSTDSKICIFNRGTGYVLATCTLQGFSASNVETWYCNILTMSGFYSTILNPIFDNPVILEAERYIDPLTADNIMNTRVINSVQLGGRYWVDSMAYNLTTGQSKMTLIKLP